MDKRGSLSSASKTIKCSMIEHLYNSYPQKKFLHFNICNDTTSINHINSNLMLYCSAANNQYQLSIVITYNYHRMHDQQQIVYVLHGHFYTCIHRLHITLNISAWVYIKKKTCTNMHFYRSSFLCRRTRSITKE